MVLNIKQIEQTGEQNKKLKQETSKKSDPKLETIGQKHENSCEDLKLEAMKTRGPMIESKIRSKGGMRISLKLGA